MPQLVEKSGVTEFMVGQGVKTPGLNFWVEIFRVEMLCNLRNLGLWQCVRSCNNGAK